MQGLYERFSLEHIIMKREAFIFEISNRTIGYESQFHSHESQCRILDELIAREK